MKNRITRSLALCALAGALLAPVAKADPAPARADVASACTLVNCSNGWYCCNHCDIRTTVCITP